MTTLIPQIQNAIIDFEARLDQSRQQQHDGTSTTQASALEPYQNNLHYLTETTPMMLRLARDIASAYGKEALAAWYDKKLREKEPNDESADTQNPDDGEILVEHLPDPTPAISQLLSYQEQMIILSPANYVGYTLYSDYIISKLIEAGPSMLQLKMDWSKKNLTSAEEQTNQDCSYVAEHLDDLVDIEDLDTIVNATEQSMSLLQNSLTETSDSEIIRTFAPLPDTTPG